MVKDIWDKVAHWLVVISFAVALLFSLGILGWQVFKWMRTGVWIPLPFSKAFEYFGADLSPIYYPSDWYGLAKIGQWILELPLSLCIPAIIIASALVVKGFVSTE